MNNAQLLRDSEPIRLLETPRSLIEYILTDVVFLLVMIHGCLWSLITNFRPHQLGNAAEGKIHRMLSNDVVWAVCGLRCSKCVGVISQCSGFGCVVVKFYSLTNSKQQKSTP